MRVPQHVLCRFDERTHCELWTTIDVLLVLSLFIIRKGEILYQRFAFSDTLWINSILVLWLSFLLITSVSSWVLYLYPFTVFKGRDVL